MVFETILKLVNLLRTLKEKSYLSWKDRGDMRKIHVTRQFFEASGSQGHFFEETKKPVFR